MRDRIRRHAAARLRAFHAASASADGLLAENRMAESKATAKVADILAQLVDQARRSPRLSRSQQRRDQEIFDDLAATFGAP